MNENEEFVRQLIVEEAKTWLGTPYVSNGAIKGAGVDCAMILLKIFSDLKLIEYFDPRPYPAQWAIHQKSEVYLSHVLRYAGEIVGPPKPGDIVMFKFGHCWAHSGLVTSWPDLIHANPPGACRPDNAERNSALKSRRPRFFSLWAEKGLTLE
jgi:cell wall-associated NlpC family hydrolase